ncbi:MAG: T9SS type A sorting domain-containing protein [Bacteroidota bacterium]
MKSLSTLSIVIVLSLLVNINNVFSYEEKTLKEITTVSTDSLNAKSLLSAYYGDTLVIKGVVGVSVLVNVSKGDRRPIMLTGASWTTYLQTETTVSESQKAGILMFQRDTLIKTTGFDKLQTGDLIEATVVVGSLPYKFDATNQTKITATALELLSIIPVKVLASKQTLNPAIKTNISSFYKGNKVQNPLLETGSGFIGQKVSLDSLTVTATSPQIIVRDNQGNSIVMNEQSGYYTTRSHFIEESEFRPLTVGQKIYKMEGYISSLFVAGSGGGFGNGSALYTYTISPALPGDLNSGPKPSQLSVVRVQPAKLFPSSSDIVSVIFEILPGANFVPIGNIFLEYSIDDGKTYTKIPAEEDITGNYLGKIPAQSAGTIVYYMLTATDEVGETYKGPVNGVYYYKVVNQFPSIADIRRPDTIDAMRIISGSSVTIEATVMSDTNDIFGDGFQNPSRIILQDGIAPWSGAAIFRFGNDSPAWKLKRGEKVRLTAKLQEFGGSLNFQSVDTVITLGQTELYAPVALSTADFGANPGGTENSDQWRNMLVEFNNVEIGKIEPSSPQSTGEFLIVDEALKATPEASIRLETDESKLTYTTRDSIVSISKRVKPTIGEKISFVRGIINADFRTRRYKLIPRNDRDFSIVTDIKTGDADIPQLFVYPNPVKDKACIDINIEKESLVSVDIISTITGNKITSTKEYLSAGLFTLQINTSELTSGSYIISVISGTNTQTLPLVINK